MKALVISVIAIIVVVFLVYGRGYWHPFYVKAVGMRTVNDVVGLYGDKARSRVVPDFDRANITYPPKKLAFLAMKDVDAMELWALNEDIWRKVKVYEIKAASGKSGPKLREGDRQVPEGIYRVVGLNPNSAYHLSMKLDYPNKFDLVWAEKEKRTEPGSNIFIHGKSVSIGCLAMGDEAIEELFVLAHDVGASNIKVVIAPTDPRERELVPASEAQLWVNELYKNIEAAFEPFK